MDFRFLSRIMTASTILRSCIIPVDTSLVVFSVGNIFMVPRMMKILIHNAKTALNHWSKRDIRQHLLPLHYFMIQ